MAVQKRNTSAPKTNTFDKQTIQKFLSEASIVLASSLDYETTLKRVSHLAVPAFGDWCAITVVDNDEQATPHEVVVHHADPQMIKFVKELQQQYPPDPASQNAAFKTGKSEIIPVITEDMLIKGAKDKKHLSLIRKLNLTSIIIVPLIARSKILGTIALASAESGKYYTKEDLALAEDLARRAALAVDNARLYHEAQREIEKRKKTEEKVRKLNTELEQRVLERTLQLEELQHQHEQILEAAGEGIFGLDRQGRVTFLNPAAERMLGYTADELKGEIIHNFTHMYHADGKRYARKDCPIYHAYIDQEVTHSTDEVFFRKDGSAFPIDYISTPIVKDGKTIGAVVTFSDITARKIAEQALADSELRYRSVVSALEEGVILQNANGDIETYNKNAKRILGITLDQFRQGNSGKNSWRLIQEDGSALSEDEQPVSITLRTGKPITNYVIGIVCPHEPIKWISVNSRPLIKDNETKPYAVVASFTDITKRKETEEAMNTLNRELRRSNRELQDFASVASHDLQEPLRKIQAFGDRLQAKYAPLLSDEGQNYIQRMQNASKRMQTLIEDLLTFSRVTTKAQPFSPVNVGEVTQEVLGDLEVRIEQTGASVKIGKLPVIEADPLQIRLLMQNLIGNGLKFHKQDEKPVITVTSHSLKEEKANSHPSRKIYQIVVEDNGIGFDERYLDRIFNVFQRLHSNQEYAGTGVGLAVCRKIAERHNGSITAESAPGKGATFIVTLPSIQPKEGGEV